MRKLFIFLLGVTLSTQAVYSQSGIQTWTENFDGSVSFSASSTPTGVFAPGIWKPNTGYYKSGQSYWAEIPFTYGQSYILQSPVYDLTNLNFVTLRFNHICKVSPRDSAFLQYREVGGSSVWKNVDVLCYLGTATGYGQRGFSANSYTQWRQDDSTIFPAQSWWQEEIFDVSSDINMGFFEFRFILKRGNTPGTDQSYGWLIDDFELMAAPFQLLPPTVQFTAPLVKDTVYSTGPWDIHAKVRTNTTARIENPWLHYTATYGGIQVAKDSILMTNVSGDSSWIATIPQFRAGTHVDYSITGRDTVGNYATATSWYIPKFGMPTQGEITIGSGTASNIYYPFHGWVPHSWSRQLYLATEIEQSGKGGVITQLAWSFYYGGNRAFPGQKCYLEATSATDLTACDYQDPAIVGATQVWAGTFNTVNYTWCQITFDNRFYLPPGKNLIVHWENQQNVSVGTDYRFYTHTTPVNRASQQQSGQFASFDDLTATGWTNCETNRLNIKLWLTDEELYNSVKLYSIDIPDTVGVSPNLGQGIPVVANFQNRGASDLDSVIISYSINGGAIISKTWYGNLPWEFYHQDTLGYYQPKMNGHDTVKMWVSLPNGVTDTTVWDDTLTQYVYGSADILMTFVDFPAATVNTTGPFAVSARIVSLTGATIPPVDLVVTTTYGGSPSSVTLPMTFDPAANVYRATIPQTKFNSDIVYSITLTDNLGNVVVIDKTLSIQPPAGIQPNSVALVAVLTPLSGGTVGTTPIPIQVVIKNKGMNDLATCNIRWTKNGVTQTTYSYSGPLPADFSDTLTIDNYQPTLGQRDTIWVKVSDPNTAADPDGNDDSLRVITLGCDGTLTGILTVGTAQGSKFSSMGYALAAIRDCALTGDLILQLKGTFAESIDLTNMDPYLRGYHLTITSADNHPDSAIIQPAASDAGIKLGNTRNITIQAITINKATSTSQHCIQFTAACTNIVIRDCKLLANNTTSSDISPVRKDNSTGVADSIFIIHNTIDGGATGINFYAGTGTGAGQYGTNIVIDSNTITNAYTNGMFLYYGMFSISFNKIIHRTSNVASNMVGIDFRASNGSIIGNRITAWGTPSFVDGIYLRENSLNAPQKILIANNDIRIYATGTRGECGIEMTSNSIYLEIVHNSIYLNAAAERASAVWIRSSVPITMKNNLFATVGADHQIIYDINHSYTLQDFDYNNYYSYNLNQNNLGNNNQALFYVNGGSPTLKHTLAQIVAQFPNDQHSVSIQPVFIDSLVNLDLTPVNTGYYCPILPNVTYDIEGRPRAGQATMGAYQIVPRDRDLAINNFVSWETEVIEDQTVSVEIAVESYGGDSVRKAVFGWTLNGQPMTPYTWQPTNPLGLFNQQNVVIGSFPVVSNTGTYDVVAWVESVNDLSDMYPSNDTLPTSAVLSSLAEFTAPLIEDTINDLSFEVTALIRTGTGAPVSPPQLMLATTINGYLVIYDSVSMVQDGAVWKALVPEQYLNSKVVYWLTVSDASGHTHTCIDSTFIEFIGFGITDPARTIGTGTNTNEYIVYGRYWEYSYVRHYYMDYEINPSRAGGFINSIAFYNNTGGSYSHNNISFYLKAVSDSTNSLNGYVDPAQDGATLVWGPAASTTQQGWNVFVLNAPFYLPPHQNLLFFCDNKSGAWSSSTRPAWQYTSTSPRNGSFGRYASSWIPSSYSTSSTDRPNLQIDIYGTAPYSGNNLSIMGLVNPVNNPDSICAEDYSPVKVLLTNSGENDYDFTWDDITLSYEITDQAGHSYSGNTLINTGFLASTESAEFEVMSQLPIMYVGVYTIKVWLTSPIDNKRYDDTLLHTYISNRLSLPLDEDFSSLSFPNEFITKAQSGAAVWQPYIPNQGEVVQPDYGSGFLRFNGSAGSTARLTTRQLDLSGSVNPYVEFWYFHDTTRSLTNNMSYLSVNAVVGGVVTNLALLYQSRAVGHGWQHYSYSLNQFAGASQCFYLQFDAMNRAQGVTQYIDRIYITSQQDLAVTEVIVEPNVDVCDMTNKQIQVVIQPTTSQAIDLTANPTTLRVEIEGSTNTYDIPLQGRTLLGNTADTIPITSSVDLAFGNYAVKAFLVTSVDVNPSNDTARYIVDITPAIAVNLVKQSQPGSCIDAGVAIKQPMTIQNTGNVPLSNIKVRLSVVVGSGVLATEIEETIPGPLDSGEIFDYTMNSAYLVPWYSDYTVFVNLTGCDPVNIKAESNVYECANTHNLAIVRIDSPSGTDADTAGRSIPVTITLRNMDDLRDFQDVKATITIRGSNGVTAGLPISEVIPFDVISLDSAEYTFTQRYTVPDDSYYSLIVFISDISNDPLDNFPKDDTITIVRTIADTTPIGISTFDGEGISLGQNIPNPANDRTEIHYSIPSDGSVTFYVYSVSGQLLHSQTTETTFGAHSIELNTSDLAAGMYFYAMEFKGQRLVKRMVIKQ